jgi:hypothetical protein
MILLVCSIFDDLSVSAAVLCEIFALTTSMIELPSAISVLKSELDIFISFPDVSMFLVVDVGALLPEAAISDVFVFFKTNRQILNKPVIS